MTVLTSHQVKVEPSAPSPPSHLPDVKEAPEAPPANGPAPMVIVVPMNAQDTFSERDPRWRVSNCSSASAWVTVLLVFSIVCQLVFMLTATMFTSVFLSLAHQIPTVLTVIESRQLYSEVYEVFNETRYELVNGTELPIEEEQLQLSGFKYEEETKITHIKIPNNRRYRRIATYYTYRIWAIVIVVCALRMFADMLGLVAIIKVHRAYFVPVFICETLDFVSALCNALLLGSVLLMRGCRSDGALALFVGIGLVIARIVMIVFVYRLYVKTLNYLGVKQAWMESREQRWAHGRVRVAVAE